MCSPWPFLSLVFDSDAKLQKAAAAVFWSFLRSTAGREKDLRPGVWDTGSRPPWVRSSKAKVERCFCRTLSPHALLGVFADLQWAPHLQPSTDSKSSLSCYNEGRVLLSPCGPSYLHPMDLNSSVLPPTFQKRKTQTTSSGLFGSQI